MATNHGLGWHRARGSSWDYRQGRGVGVSCVVIIDLRGGVCGGRVLCTDLVVYLIKGCDL